MNVSEHHFEAVINKGTAIVLQIISFCGLFANLIVFIAFLIFRYWNKGPLILLFFNLLFCNTVQLFIISFYLIYELLYDHFTEIYKNTISSISLWIWYVNLCGYLFVSTYCYFHVCHSEKLSNWFTKIRVTIVLISTWSVSLLISLSSFVGPGCANIILMNYAFDATNECETYRGFVSSPLQILIHSINFIVIFWMAFCYISIMRHLKTIKPEDGTLFIKIANYNAETDYRRKRLITFQFLTVSITFVAFCAVFLIANLSHRNPVITISQRILFALNSASPPLVLIKTTKSLQRDIFSALKVFMCKSKCFTIIHGQELAINLAALPYCDQVALEPRLRLPQLGVMRTPIGSSFSTMDL